jgi:hypothetical protein
MKDKRKLADEKSSLDDKGVMEDVEGSGSYTKTADDFEDPESDLHEQVDSYSNIQPPERVEEEREAAQQQGFKWEGFFDEDEDGQTFKLTKGKETLYLNSQGGWLLEIETGNRGDERSGTSREGTDLESLIEAITPKPEPEEIDEEAELESTASEVAARISKYLHGRGELEYGEALSEGGRDSAEDFIGDIVRDKFNLGRSPYDYPIYELVMQKLKAEFIDPITDEDEAEYEFQREERNSRAVKPRSLTDREIEILADGAYRTWQGIGHDVLAMQERKIMSARQVAEIVLDANHMDAYGNVPKPLMEKFYALSPEEREYVMQQAFPLGSNYGE